MKELLEQDPVELLNKGLEEIGKAGETLEVTFLQRNADNETKVAAEYYQNQWQTKLGVVVNIETASDNSSFNNQVSKGQYQICQTGWGADYNDPMTFMPVSYTHLDVYKRQEGLCARMACERITREQLDEMEEVILLSKFHEKKGNYDQLVELDSRFHEILFEGCQSKLLEHELKNLHQYVPVSYTHLYPTPPALRESPTGSIPTIICRMRRRSARIRLW